MSPLVSELTVIGELDPLFDPVAPPLLDVHVAVKPVMALPPLLPAVKVTDPELAPAVAATPVGAAGTVGPELGTKLLEAAEAALLPMALVASTVQV